MRARAARSTRRARAVHAHTCRSLDPCLPRAAAATRRDNRTTRCTHTHPSPRSPAPSTPAPPAHYFLNMPNSPFFLPPELPPPLPFVSPSLYVSTDSPRKIWSPGRSTDDVTFSAAAEPRAEVDDDHREGVDATCTRVERRDVLGETATRPDRRPRRSAPPRRRRGPAPPHRRRTPRKRSPARRRTCAAARRRPRARAPSMPSPTQPPSLRAHSPTHAQRSRGRHDDARRLRRRDGVRTMRSSSVRR